ncbi:DNA gyrase inhibitor YacG [Niveibacterium terrae]|uniref:DNA gyrase inhibitor YacG n=1 Tax=Niveibacterium terrae TaxID=3373598 RepID=UPI003A900EC3
MSRTVKCPTCGKPVEWTPESRYRPFCSERCKLIDLGAWASETYRVPCDSPDPGEDGETPDPASRRN